MPVAAFRKKDLLEIPLVPCKRKNSGQDFIAYTPQKNCSKPSKYHGSWHTRHNKAHRKTDRVIARIRLQKHPHRYTIESPHFQS
ncbi:MAG: hypothetical protein MK103_06720, partial [Planctomycetes bacterium]|nr:hypothetical protein [Planctomycetota bacterium]